MSDWTVTHDGQLGQGSTLEEALDDLERNCSTQADKLALSRDAVKKCKQELKSKAK